MRTQQEIVEQIKKQVAEALLFDFGISNLLVYLDDYETAKPFLNEGVTEEQFKEATKGRRTPQEEILDYMGFAWEKANDCRGLSAMRSLQHMKAWLWLDGKDALLDRIHIDDYTLYGKPQLRAISEEYGIDWKALDDGSWKNSEDGVSVPAEEVEAL
jgi:hypothetical protein